MSLNGALKVSYHKSGSHLAGYCHPDTSNKPAVMMVCARRVDVSVFDAFSY